ncbi:hypothetical protein GQX74_015024 [Glossina fuscipes]|nr:hypothetical protein GQX74_015024 [Glossina fuscipes]
MLKAYLYNENKTEERFQIIEEYLFKSVEYRPNDFQEYTFAIPPQQHARKPQHEHPFLNPGSKKTHTNGIRVTFGRLRMGANIQNGVTQPFGKHSNLNELAIVILRPKSLNCANASIKLSSNNAYEIQAEVASGIKEHYLRHHHDCVGITLSMVLRHLTAKVRFAIGHHSGTTYEVFFFGQAYARRAQSPSTKLFLFTNPNQRTTDITDITVS